MAEAVRFTASTGSGSADQGVLAQVHGCRARVGFNAAQGQVEPLLPQRSEHHADGLGLVLKDRALFDMGLEIGPNRVTQHRARAGIADSVQGFAHADALGITLGQGFLQGELAGEHP